MVKILSTKHIRRIAIVFAILCTITSHAQLGQWIAEQIEAEIRGQISSITNFNANYLGSFGNYIWESIVSGKCESDLENKAREFKNFEIDTSFLQRVPQRYPLYNTYWTNYSQIVPILRQYGNSFFHKSNKIKFKDIANSKIDEYAVTYIDSIASSLSIRDLNIVLNPVVLDSLRVLSDNHELVTTLLDDININPNIAFILNNHPEALRVYVNTLEAPLLRKDPQHLLYWAVQADSHKNILSLKRPLINPRELQFIQNDTIIDVKNVETIIAYISGNDLEVLDINIMNLLGRPNTKYIFGNNTWETDFCGRVINATQDCNKSLKRKCKQKSVLKAKSLCNILGNPNTREVGYYNSLEYGAPDVLLNVYFYDKSKQNKTAIKHAKKDLNVSLKDNGLTVTNTVMAGYSNNSRTPATIRLYKENYINSSLSTITISRTIPDTKRFIYRNNIQPIYKTDLMKK